jgi:transcriptional regulator with XRE-family HTH domain
MRKIKRMTQQQLADRLRLAKSTISQYETGTNEPDADTIRRIADILECSADYLLGRTDNPQIIEVEGESEVSPEEREFLEWVEENLEDTFFYDFSKSPEESKREMMETLRFIWEREKRRRPGQKQGE